jgi:hypothetical protein
MSDSRIHKYLGRRQSLKKTSRLRQELVQRQMHSLVIARKAHRVCVCAGVRRRHVSMSCVSGRPSMCMCPACMRRCSGLGVCRPTAAVPSLNAASLSFGLFPPASSLSVQVGSILSQLQAVCLVGLFPSSIFLQLHGGTTVGPTGLPPL